MSTVVLDISMTSTSTWTVSATGLPAPVQDWSMAVQLPEYVWFSNMSVDSANNPSRNGPGFYGPADVDMEIGDSTWYFELEMFASQTGTDWYTATPTKGLGVSLS